MTRRGRAIAAGAAAVSVGLHAAGLIALAPDAPQSLAGGPPQLAMLGNSFEDAIAGTVTGAVDPVPSPIVEATSAAVAAVRPAPALSPTGPQTLIPAAPVLPGTASAVGVAEATAPVTAPVDPVPASRPTPTATPAPTGMDRVTGRDAPVTRTADADTPRPQPRIARPAPTVAPPHQPAATPQGNDAETKRAGSADATPEGKAARTQSGAGGQAGGDGQAAAAYPQLVNRHLSRLRRPDARFEGAAVIAFTIAANGDVAALAIAQSSGNAAFDRLALAHIQRAAPFPPPPGGAQRNYNVTVRAR